MRSIMIHSRWPRAFLQLLLFIAGIVSWTVQAEVLRLDAGNFELAVQTYPYLAILFYDDHPLSVEMLQKWEKAAVVVEGRGASVPLAAIDATLPDVDELVASYGFVTPAVRLFRRRIMFDFAVEPHDSAEDIADSLIEEGKAAVRSASSAAELSSIPTARADGSNGPLVLGFFNRSDVEESEKEGSGPYTVFLSAADQLRGYATFVTGGMGLMVDYDIKNRPAVVYVGDKGEKEARHYSGEWSDVALADWVMAQEVPHFGRLARSMAEGASSPDYGSKFFGSSLVKFIAFVRKAEGEDEEGAYASLLRGLKQAAEEYRGQALFAYCVEGTFPEASAYLNVDANRLPALYFYNPHTENRLASPSLAPLEPSEVARFVSAVLLGTYLPTPKSEPAPAKTDKGRPVPVHRLVGTTFLDEVGVAGKDVLVLLTTPFCQPCLDIATSFELLGKAFQSEPRVVLAKMDTQLNDLPPGVKVERTPALLLFPASRKPFTDAPVPHVVSDPSPSLHDLVDVLHRHGSFGKDLRIATHEQLGALVVDEEIVRASLEEQQRALLRNYLRNVYDHPVLDWLAGEVVFDGRRWHWALAGISLLANVILVLFVMAQQDIISKRARASAQTNGRDKSE